LALILYLLANIEAACRPIKDLSSISFNIIVVVAFFQAFSPPDCTEHEKAVVKAGDESSKIFL